MNGVPHCVPESGTLRLRNEHLSRLMLTPADQPRSPADADRVADSFIRSKSRALVANLCPFLWRLEVDDFADDFGEAVRQSIKAPAGVAIR